MERGKKKSRTNGQRLLSVCLCSWLRLGGATLFFSLSLLVIFGVSKYVKYYFGRKRNHISNSKARRKCRTYLVLMVALSAECTPWPHVDASGGKQRNEMRSLVGSLPLGFGCSDPEERILGPFPFAQPTNKQRTLKSSLTPLEG